MRFLKAVSSFVAELTGGSGQATAGEHGVGSVLVSPSDHGPRYPAAGFWPLLKQGFEQNPIVYSGVMYLARSIAGSPVRTFDEDGSPLKTDRIRELLKVTNVRDNELQLWVLMTIWKMCAGNAYWHKVRNGAGQVIELWPLRPDRVGVIPDRELVIGAYVYSVAGERFIVAPQDLLHFSTARSQDDFFGFAPLAAARQAIGTDNEATSYANALLVNSAIPGVVVTTETILNKQKSQRLRAMWTKRYGGQNRGVPAFLQKGMDVKIVGLDLKELAFTELTNTQEARILSVVGIPPILTGAAAGLERSTYANYEQARAAFWETTAPWWQSEFAAAINHDPDLRPAPTTMVAFDNSKTPAFTAKREAAWDRVTKAVGNKPIISVNEARAELGLPKSDDPEHDEIAKPEPPPAPGDDPNGPPKPGAKRPPPPKEKGLVLRIEHAITGARTKADDALENLDDSTGRVAKAERYKERLKTAARYVFVTQAEDVDAIWRSTALGNEFTAQLEAAISHAVKGRVEAWSRVADETFRPIVTELMGQSVRDAAMEKGFDIRVDRPEVRQFMESYSYKFAQKISNTSADEVRELLLSQQQAGATKDQIADALKEKFVTWKDSRAEAVAQSETIRSANRGAQLAYRSVGLQRKKWLASDDACEICLALNGTVVGIDTPFVAKDAEFNPLGDDGQPALKSPFVPTYEDVETPPAHPHCRCTIVADDDMED